MMTEYRMIDFGRADAATESAMHPELLLSGFFRYDNVINEAVYGQKFLFLGYKGSGKSAISEHIKLTSENDPTLFVNIVQLGSLSHNELRQVVGLDLEPESAYIKAWSWLLLVKLFSIFSLDEGSPSNKDPKFINRISQLSKLGLLPTTDLSHAVQISKNTALRLDLVKTLQLERGNSHVDAGTSIPFFTERLKRLACEFISPNRHLLIIDGLDDIMPDAGTQLTSLAGLLTEVFYLNLEFMRNGVSAKIIVLCRTDIFDRIQSANKNKIKQDFGYVIDWYDDPRRPDKSKLVRLANQKASVSVPAVNLFRDYFPQYIKKYPTANFILEHTRHTPRDLLRVFDYIKSYSARGPLEFNQILAGLRKYSLEYFLSEIKDELVGHIPSDDVEKIFASISLMQRREFFMRELLEIASDVHGMSKSSVESALYALFECSAIGNVNHLNGRNIYSFKFRNRSSHINFKAKIRLHRGLWKALNLA